MQTVVLTTEEEGVALAAGAHLGGQRAVLLMQSSGVGNCINMLSLPVNCRMPFLTLVTMRGEWAEFNPWQVPMGAATPAVLAAAGVHVRRADVPDDAAEMVAASAALAFAGGVRGGVVFSQRLVGARVFAKWGTTARWTADPSPPRSCAIRATCSSSPASARPATMPPPPANDRSTSISGVPWV